MKILLVDDHLSFCEGLIAAIATIRDDYEVDSRSDAALIPESLFGETDYDLYIVDLMMPGLGGVELIKYLNNCNNQTPVMVMSSVLDVAAVKQLFKLGIIGYMPKSYSVYQVVEAIEECRKGDLHIPPFLVRRVGDDQVSAVESNFGISLTRRQMEVISLIDKGLSNQQIADTLFIGKATVKTHVNQLFKTFDVNNRISCLRAARKAGLLITS